MKYIIQAFMIFAIFLLLYGCNADNQNDKEQSTDQPMTVGEIAFTSDNPYGCRIYLDENNELVPFIVLTSNYNGNCLLLREYLLDDSVPYNASGEYGSYYNGSNIDRFLNENYFFRLSEKIRQLIVTSEVKITSKAAIDSHADDRQTIMRNVFLLSANEVNASLSSVALKEGEPLSYFKNGQNRIASFSNLKKGPWMLRTSALRDGNTIIGVADDGSVGMGGINSIAGCSDSAVRPAFCIPSDTPIVLSDKSEIIFCIK